MKVTTARDEAALMRRVRAVQERIEGPAGPGIHHALVELEDEARAMSVSLCDFVRDRAPDFLPYYYLLEGAQACDDPAVPLWVRQQVREARYSAGN